MPDLPGVLATHTGMGYIVAPAGFGKTHLIAQSVARAQRRQLVLTHTYAGVHALQRKMRELSVPSALFQIDTIASWALRLCLSYSATAAWTVERPSSAQWTKLYRACTALLDHTFARRIVNTSYAGLYVDEYQDCSMVQHELVLKLARDLPCRVLGDPLQAVFDFKNESVEWHRDVVATFEQLGDLDTPYRWEKAGRPEMGTWLRHARAALENGRPVRLDHGLPTGIVCKHVKDTTALLRVQGNACRYLTIDRADTAIAIHKGSPEYKAKCHNLARSVAGKFGSIEEIEGKALFAFVKKVELAPTATARLVAVLKFAADCLTNVKENLAAATRKGTYAKLTKSTRNPSLAKAANDYLDTPTNAAMAALLVAIRSAAGVELVRMDLFNRMLSVLRKQALNPPLSLTEAAEKYHAEFRHSGRPVGRRLIGTTLLVKGLEFDHAIVLDASSLSRRELYVALTRGAKSLTIIATSAELNPPG